MTRLFEHLQAMIYFTFSDEDKKKWKQKSMDIEEICDEAMRFCAGMGRPNGNVALYEISMTWTKAFQLLEGEHQTMTTQGLDVLVHGKGHGSMERDVPCPVLEWHNDVTMYILKNKTPADPFVDAMRAFKNMPTGTKLDEAIKCHYDLFSSAMVFAAEHCESL